MQENKDDGQFRDTPLQVASFPPERGEGLTVPPREASAATTPVTATAESTTPPADAVWVSKEEYQRLRDAADAAIPVMGSGATASFAYQESSQKGDKKDFWTYAVAAIALVVFIGLTSNFGGFFTIPAIGGLIVFAILAIKSLVSSKTPRYVTGSSQPSSDSSKKVVGIVGLIIGLVILVPAAPFILLILWLMFMGLTGQSVGS